MNSRKPKKIEGNTVLGELSRNCELCMQGAKLVLFVTGLCDLRCYFCPISVKRWGVDTAWANERMVNSDEDVLLEAHRMDALGAGITGGNPLKRLDRTIRYIELLKDDFGSNFLIHLYSAGTNATDEVLEALSAAGLDEIRFNTYEHGAYETAMKYDFTVGCEMPVVPGDDERLIEHARWLDELGASFMNLNELEFAERNVDAMEKRGFQVKSDTSCAVLESEDAAMRVIEECAASDMNLGIHYCRSSYKDAVQLRMRLMRTALNVAKKYERVNEDGLLVKGVINVAGASLDDLESMRSSLSSMLRVSPKHIFVDNEKMRLETTINIAARIAGLGMAGIECCIVEEYPTADRLETEVVPIP